MTTGPRSQCDTCVRYRTALQRADDDWSGQPFCAAFPEADGGIPDRVLQNGLDHRQPVDGDHGLRWLPKPGEQFPEYAFLPQFLGQGSGNSQ